MNADEPLRPAPTTRLPAQAASRASTRTGRRHPVARTLTSAIASAALLATAPAQTQVQPQTQPQVHTHGQPSSTSRLPALGDSVSAELDLVAERRLGDRVMREVRRDPDVLDDPLLLAYVQSIWAPLVSSARQRGDIDADTERAFAWEAFLVRDRSVNAFALPGGFIGVYLGLVATTSTTDELAAVLAHEMAHVTQRHIARSITNQSTQSMLALAAMLAGLVAAGKSSNPHVAAAVITGGQAAMVQGQMNFSRDMEREADRVGYGIFAGADYAPRGVAAMFEKLEAAYRLNDTMSFPYLRSHPLTVERIGDARARVEAQPSARAAVVTPAHEFMRARARVLMDPRADVLGKHLRAATTPATGASNLDRATAHYAAAVAALALRENAAALTAARAAQQAWRDASGSAVAATGKSPEVELALRLVLAQALHANGDSAGAIKLLDGEGAGSRAAMLARAGVAQDLARAPAATGAGNTAAIVQSSIETLQTWTAEHRRDALAWAALARLNELSGLRLRALRADAEVQASLGDVGGAIDRLRAAQRLARELESRATPTSGDVGSARRGDRFDAAIVDSRVRDLLALHRDLYPEAPIRP